jgi:hypothetical protein
MISEKVCTKCKIMKSFDEYHNLKNGVYGKHSNCKICRKTYRKELSFKKPINGKMKCEKCNIIKNVKEFYKDRSKSTGLQSYCINCQKEKVYESSSKLDNYLTYYISFLKKQNKDFNLSLKDLLEIYEKQNRKCSLIKELLTYYNGKCLTENKYEKKFNIKIQKIDNDKGFNKDNILLIGNSISKMIGNMELKEFKRICKLVCE